MELICKVTNKSFIFSDLEKKFIEKISPVFAGKKFTIPVPNYSPDERCRQRTLHRNEQHLYKDVSSFSNKSLISIYPPNRGLQVVAKEEWFSDNWDATEFAQEFSKQQNFFAQYQILQSKVPRASTVVFNNENCEYTTGTGYCKDCYLINSSEYCENCSYGKLFQNCKDVYDSSYIYDSELLYECFNIKNGYNCRWVYNSQTVTDCAFCDDLRNCKNCILSSNLVGKQYYWQNKQISKEEYLKKEAELFNNQSLLQKAKILFEKVRKERVYKYANVLNIENCSGDFIFNSKNCLDSYDMSDCEDCNYSQVGIKSKDCMDTSNAYIDNELCYQSLGMIANFYCNFCLYVFHSKQCWYCEQCYNCEDCFGCIGLRHKKYCILNKQYPDKLSYGRKVAEIVEHMQHTKEWGEYFPAELSPFAYNKTVAHEYFPLTKEQAAARNYYWEDGLEVSQSKNARLLSEFRNIDELICEAVLKCKQTGKGYKIQVEEYKFYKKMNLPLPDVCPDFRYQQRLKLRNPRKLYQRKCPETGEVMLSPYGPESDLKILSEKAYQQIVC